MDGTLLKKKFDEEFNALQKLVAVNPVKGILVSMALGAAALRILEWLL